MENSTTKNSQHTMSGKDTDTQGIRVWLMHKKVLTEEVKSVKSCSQGSTLPKKWASMAQFKHVKHATKHTNTKLVHS